MVPFFSSIFFFFNTIPETPLGLRPRFARNKCKMNYLWRPLENIQSFFDTFLHFVSNKWISYIVVTQQTKVETKKIKIHKYKKTNFCKYTKGCPKSTFTLFTDKVTHFAEKKCKKKVRFDSFFSFSWIEIVTLVFDRMFFLLFCSKIKKFFTLFLHFFYTCFSKKTFPPYIH